MPRKGRSGRLNLSGIRILVIEDHEDTREALCRSMVGLGADVAVAENGQTGIKEAMRTRPNLVLCDLLMPDVDGFGFIRRLHASDDLCNVPVIAISALGTDADLKRTWEAGFSGHLVKPLDPSALEAQLRRIFWAHDN